MMMGSVICVLVGETGRGRGDDLYKALESATAGSMLGAVVAQIAMMMIRKDGGCFGDNASWFLFCESWSRWSDVQAKIKLRQVQMGICR